MSVVLIEFEGVKIVLLFNCWTGCFAVVCIILDSNQTFVLAELIEVMAPKMPLTKKETANHC